MSFKDVVDIVESCALIIAALVAVFGIAAWRREHVGRRRIELAEEVLAMFYEARLLVGAIRSRYIYFGEGSSREATEEESLVQKNRRDRANAINERFHRHQASFAKLGAVRFRFMAVFGADKEQLFERFDQYLGDLLAAADQLEGLLNIDQIGLTAEDYGDGEYKSMLTAARRTFFGTGDENDHFRTRLDALIRDVEAVCRKEIAQI